MKLRPFVFLECGAKVWDSVVVSSRKVTVQSLDIWTLEDDTTVLSWNIRQQSPNAIVLPPRITKTITQNISCCSNFHGFMIKCCPFCYIPYQEWCRSVNHVYIHMVLHRTIIGIILQDNFPLRHEAKMPLSSPQSSARYDMLMLLSTGFS